MSDKKNTKHKASFLVSTFLLSKRSLKKIYGLNHLRIVILRYICDSIDRNKGKNKSISQSQIAKFCYCTREAANRSIAHLCKKRLIFNNGKGIYSPGKILNMCDRRITPNRSVYLGSQHKDVYTQDHTSNSSNFTNNRAGSSSHQNQKPTAIYASVQNQSTSFQRIQDEKIVMSDEEKDHYAKCRIEAMKKAKVKKYISS